MILVLHNRFPKNENLRKKWLEALGGNINSKNPTVCSRHFKQEDYKPIILPRLKDNVIPHVVLDVLEYVHSKGYVHGDINGSNILLGLKEGTENQAYLVNYRLALRVDDSIFKPNRRRAHYGTIKYTSRDAHLGVPTMRGDLEMVGYNMMNWLLGGLSWGQHKEPKAVQLIKQAFMDDPRLELPRIAPEALINFFEYINTLKPKDSIDYAKCRQILQSYLKSQGVRPKGKLKVTFSEEDRLDRGFSPITFDAEPSRDKKVRPKRKLQSAQEVSGKRVVTKKVTDVKPKASTSREADRRRN